jgi:F-type H+-transporting ATPase subunit delta
MAEDQAAAVELGRALRVACETFAVPEARLAVTSPAVAADDQEAVIQELARATKLPDDLMRFLLVLFRAGRLGALDEVLVAYEDLAADRFKVRRAEVRTAHPLDDEQTKTLTEKLSALAGAEVELDVIEDPSLLAGWRARVGNTLVEADLKSRFGRIKDRVTGRRR